MIIDLIHMYTFPLKTVLSQRLNYLLPYLILVIESNSQRLSSIRFLKDSDIVGFRKVMNVL